MDRRFAEYDAKHGPLFQNLKHKNRLNIEDSSLVSDKWTTRMFDREMEAMPIILEEVEQGGRDGDISIEERETETRITSSVLEVVSSLVENVELLAQSSASIEESQLSVSDIQPDFSPSDDFSCIFTNAVPSSNSIPDCGFETMFANDSFSQHKFQKSKTSFCDFLDSSSDEEMDDTFKFRVSLPKRKVRCDIQPAEARTVLIDRSEEDSVISLPSTSQAEEVNVQDISEHNVVTSSSSTECEVVMGIMEADFSDSSTSEQHSFLPSSRRMARPLSLRYSSEDVDDDFVKMLCHATSFMNFLTKKDEETAEGSSLAYEGSALLQNLDGSSPNPPKNATSSPPESKGEFQTLFTKFDKNRCEPQIPSCSSGETSSLAQPTTSEPKPTESPLKSKFQVSCPTLHSIGNLSLKTKLKKKSENTRLSSKTWWKYMDYSMSSDESLDEDDERGSH